MGTELLHVMQASLAFTARRVQLRQAVKALLDRDAAVIGFTEASAFRDELRELLAPAGYRLVQPNNPATGRAVTTALAVRRQDAPVAESGWQLVVPGRSELPRDGGHEARGMTWAELDWHGELVSVTEVHMLTGWGGADLQRQRDILEQWRAALSHARRMARGARLSLLMGDVNYDVDDASPNTPTQLLRSYGFTSALALAGKPDAPTHGRRTIDQVYVYNGDVRVTVQRAKVWHEPLPGIDHAQVSAWLDVRPRRMASQ